MPSPELLTSRELLAKFRKPAANGTPRAVWNAAQRLAEKYGIKCKATRPRLWYAASADAALASQPDHQFA